MSTSWYPRKKLDMPIPRFDTAKFDVDEFDADTKITEWATRTEPATSFATRTEPETTYTNRVKP